jgi:hypothetical protein
MQTRFNLDAICMANERITIMRLMALRENRAEVAQDIQLHSSAERENTRQGCGEAAVIGPAIIANVSLGGYQNGDIV